MWLLECHGNSSISYYTAPSSDKDDAKYRKYTSLFLFNCIIVETPLYLIWHIKIWDSGSHSLTCYQVMITHTHLEPYLTLSSFFSMNSSNMLTASMLTPMYSMEPCCTLGINSTSKQVRGRLPSRLTVWLGKREALLKVTEEQSMLPGEVIAEKDGCCPTYGTPQSCPLHLHGSLDSVSVWLPNVCILLPPPSHTQVLKTLLILSHVKLHHCACVDLYCAFWQRK